MSSSQNTFWTELCKELPYSPAYAISHLIDPSIFHFFNNEDKANDDSCLSIYIIYDITDEKLLIFDNGMGYAKSDIETLQDFETITAKGWKQLIRAIQWLGNSAKIFTKRDEDQYTYNLIFNTNDNRLSAEPVRKLAPEELFKKTRFESGTLIQINTDKAWTKKEFCEIANQINRIFQKYVNLDKVAIRAVYRDDEKFYDCHNVNEIERITSYRKAQPLEHILIPKLYVDPDNEKRVFINQKIDFDDKTIMMRGYASILEKPNFENSGIYCFSSNKLIRGALPNTAWKPKEIFGNEGSNEYNTIYAEIEFSNIKVNVTGDNFVLTKTEYETIARLLVSIIGKQGDHHHPRKLTTKINTVYQNTSRSIPIETVEQYKTVGEDIIDSMRVTSAIIDVNVETVTKNKRETNLYSIKDEYGKEYHIQLIRATNKEASGCWIKKKYSQDGIISVYFNYEHPFLRPIISSKRSYNAFCEFVIYYIMAEERAINEGASVEELKLLIDNYLRKGN